MHWLLKAVFLYVEISRCDWANSDVTLLVQINSVENRFTDGLIAKVLQLCLRFQRKKRKDRKKYLYDTKQVAEENRER